VFRGLPSGELSPELVTVRVLNGTDKQGLARDIAGALQKISFDMVAPQQSPEPSATTTVQHAPGQANYGQFVARYLTTPAALVGNPELGSGEVVLVAGADFTTVHEQPTPTDQMRTTTVAGQPATTATTAGGASTTTMTAPPPTTTTTAPGRYAIGEPPPGQTCDS
jgi:hypothetical protein